MPGVNENHSKLDLEGSQNHQERDLGAFRGVLGALGFSNVFLEHHVEFCFHQVGAAWSIWGVILAATGFRMADPLGVSRCIWRNRKN